MASKWLELADRLTADIEAGRYPPGAALPHIRELVRQGHGSTATVQRAYRELEDRGLVRTSRGHGTTVRDPSRIRVPLSRYSKVVSPGGTRGPWETATAAQGLDGRMVTVCVEAVPVPSDIANHLHLASGDDVILRHRRAMIEDEVVQAQRAWYPRDIAEAAGLDTPGKIEGGVLGAMTAAGLLPTRADEAITGRLPTDEEAAELTISRRLPVMVIERVTHNEAGRPIEAVRIAAAWDRLRLVYDDLPLPVASAPRPNDTHA